MQVIFTENVPAVASKGDVKNVKSGFFRNYLLPYGKAALATEPLLKEWEERRKKMLIEKEQFRAKLEEIKRRLEGASLKIEKKVTKKGTLYGGVKALDIVHGLKSQLNIEMPASAPVLSAPIKALGTFKVTLHLGEGVETAVEVEVVEKK